MTHTPVGETERQPYRWAGLAGFWLVYFCFELTSGALALLAATVLALIADRPSPALRRSVAQVEPDEVAQRLPR